VSLCRNYPLSAHPHTRSSLDADRTVTLAGGVAGPPRPVDETEGEEIDGDFKSSDDAAFRRDVIGRRPAVRFPASTLRIFLAQVCV
jgi:hypothetical protein